MKKQVTARQAFARAVELADNPQRVMLINHCPDCLGTGKVNGKTCNTCGNEPDDVTGLIKRGSCWYKDAKPKRVFVFSTCTIEER